MAALKRKGCKAALQAILASSGIASSLGQSGLTPAWHTLRLGCLVSSESASELNTSANLDTRTGVSYYVDGTSSHLAGTPIPTAFRRGSHSYKKRREEKEKLQISSRAPLMKEGPISSSESSKADELGTSGKDVDQETVKTQGSSNQETRQHIEDVTPQVESTSDKMNTESSSTPFKVVFDISKQKPSHSLMDFWTSIKMAVYLKFHSFMLESQFDVEDFLEGAEHAFITVQELFGKGDFETMRNMVSPPMLTAFDIAYKQTIGKYKHIPKWKEQNLRVEYTVKKVDSARLVNFDFSFADDGRGGFGLQSLVPQLEQYHDDMFFVLAVRLHAEISICTYDQAGAMVEDSTTKGWHVVKFARQLPKLKQWITPVKELESPWYMVDLR